MLASGEWLNRDRLLRIARLCGLASLAMILWTLATSHGTLDWLGRPLGTDFSNVWTAGAMALDGRSAAVWSWPEHFTVQRALHGSSVDLFGWHYPPPFLLIASGLAFLPYLPALLMWQVGTLLPLAWLLHRMVPRRETLLLLFAAPVTMICVLHGHNGFLTAILLGGGLLLLDRRPLLAGLLFGCLIYKPQFALIIPPLLLAGQYWRAIAGACISAATLTLLTLAVWGWPVWAAFIESLPLTRGVVIEQGSTGFHKIMTPFAALRMWGGSIPLAYAVQTAFTVAAISTTAWLGWKRSAPEVRNAWVCAAVLLSTPYALDYDYVVLLPALAFLYQHRDRHGWRPWDKSLMAFVWIAPLVARQLAEHLLLPIGLLSAVTVAGLSLRTHVAASAMRAKALT